MLKWFQKKKKDNKGFSLVELIVVVAIMAILVGLVAPQYLKYVEKSKKSADANNLDEMVRAFQIYAVDSDLDATDGLPADTYTIQIGLSGTNIITPANATRKELAEDAIESTITDFKNTKLKSSKWSTTHVQAIITLDDKGGTKVEYVPEELATMIKKQAKK